MRGKGKLITLCLCMMLGLSGCYGGSEVNDLVFPLFLGVDQGEGDELLITVKFPTYTSGDGSGGGGGGEEKDSLDQGNSSVYTIEAPSILEGMELLSTTLPRRVSLSHVEFFCVSEELARKGIAREILPLIRDSGSSTTMRVVVVDDSASDFIIRHKPAMSGNYSREAAVLYESSSLSIGFDRIQFGEFYSELYSPYRDAICLYGGLAPEEGAVAQEEGMENALGLGFQAEDSPIRSPQPAQISGLAVFRGQKLVGELDSYESSLYAMIRGLGKGETTFKDPNAPGDYVVLQLENSREPKVTAWWEDGVPHVHIQSFLEGGIATVQSGVGYESQEKEEAFDAYITGILQRDMQRLLDKVRMEYQADIFGFGREFMKTCDTIEEWEDLHWFQLYPSCEITIDVEYVTRRAGILFQDAPDAYDTEKFDRP